MKKYESMGELINKIWLPQALSINVDYNVFWMLSPKRLEPFFESNKMKQNQDNKMAWLHGIYVQQAIGAAFSKNSKYPTEPLEIFQSEDSKVSDEDKFAMWANVANKEFENKMNGEM